MKFQVRQSGAEELGDWVEESSLDMITVAEAIPLIDHAVFVAAAAMVLRPAGTLAIWFYGQALFVDEGVREQCQAVLEEIIERFFDRARPFKGTAMVRSARTSRSYLDGVAFPRRERKEVERMKWNCDRPMEDLDP